ncbi:claudin-18 [Pholidichthys leucotaenia]
MESSVLQNGGSLLGVIGTAGLTAATSVNNWCFHDRQVDMGTSVYSYRGLWQDCETLKIDVFEFTECHPLSGTLGDSGTFQAVRALMIGSVVLCMAGVVTSFFSLNCLTIKKLEETTKTKMSLYAGVMFITAGSCGITGASIFANLTVSSFGSSINEGTPSYAFGPAQFTAWMGGIILLISGILKSVAFSETVKDGNTQQVPPYIENNRK